MNYNKLWDIKNEWQHATDKKIQVNTVDRRVKTLLQANQTSIEERRDRLRSLLESDEKQYLLEMDAKEETVIERQAKMREKAKALKEKRECERLNVVQEKLEQQWRENCEELRSTVSHRHTHQVATERLEQLRIQDDMKLAQREDEIAFADLWHADMLAKARKEEQQTERQMSANREMLSVLNKQVAAVEAQKQEEKALQEQEAQLLKEQVELRKLEEQRAREEKFRKQEETRVNYDRSLRMKMKRTAKEMQEQLAFDLQILEQLLEESRNEAMEDAKRKRELREEGQRYRAELQRLNEEEAAAEADLDRLCDMEVEKAWQRKLSQWRLEKEQRRKLLQEVLAARQQQVADKLHRNEQQLSEVAREREELNRQITEQGELELQRAATLRAKNRQYETDLRMQMNYEHRERQTDDQEEERTWHSQRDAEIEYQRKLEDALSSPFIEKAHPIRKASFGRRSANANDRNAALNY